VPDSELAQPRRVKTRWEDLQVPEPVQRQLQQALMHARYRLVPQPGGRESLGYRLLLSGLPGTGKSMAAEALASTLGRPVMKLDLSSVLSKWLGETERFLSQIFEIAEISGAVLVLDEADSLFRQRDSSGSGRDGLVTVVSYLLARLDRYVGLLVATTNRTRDLDEAFFRRFDDFIVLPVPDPATRRALWRQQLA
jgi:SpoVK/Ycf46/Vps4 family AAA+-type ATPase